MKRIGSAAGAAMVLALAACTSGQPQAAVSPRTAVPDAPPPTSPPTPAGQSPSADPNWDGTTFTEPPKLLPKGAPPPAAALPSPAPGWGRPALAEDFDGTAVSPARWAVYDDPTGSNPRTARATTVENGALKMTGALYGGRDLSGGIASHLALTFGRWEARMRAEKGAGYSAVMLLWPTKQGHPEWAEINFAEIPDPERKAVGLFVHQGPRDNTSSQMVRGDFTQWHTFALDWLPKKMVFSIDGKAVWTYTGPNIPQRADMHLALQNDVSCYSPVQCRTRKTPPKVSMYVDWVRVYRLPPSLR